MIQKAIRPHEFGTKTNIVLIATGTILGALYGVGDQLPLSDGILDYIKMGANFIGLLTGMVFISNDKDKLIERVDTVNGTVNTTVLSVKAKDTNSIDGQTGKQ